MVFKIPLYLFVLLILSFLFRLVIILTSEVTFFSDDAIYASLARFWVQGELNHVFHPTWPPLYPFLSALIYFFINSWELSLRLISSIAGVLIILPLYFLVKQILTKTNTLLFCFTVSFFPPSINLSLMPMSDTLATFLIVTSITLIFLGLYSKKDKFFFFGAFFLGLAALTRSEGALFFSLSLVYISVYFLINSIISNKRELILKILSLKILTILLFVVIFVLTLSPYLIFIKGTIGSWSLSHKFSAQIQQGHAFAFNERGSTWSQEVVSLRNPNYESPYFKNGMGYLLNRFNFFRRWFNEKLDKWEKVYLAHFSLWSVVLLLFSILGIFNKKLFWSLGYVFFVLITVIPVTIFSTAISDIRYLLWVIPLLLMLFFLGAERFMKIFGLKTNIVSSVLFFIIIILIAKFSPEQFNIITIPQDLTRTHYRQEVIDAAEWINNHNKKTHPKIMMRYEAIEFYTDGEIIYMPQISSDQILKYAQLNKVDYIIAWERELSKDENLQGLLDINIEHPGFKKVHQIPEEQPKIIIYVL